MNDFRPTRALRATKEEKMAMVRLGAVLEVLLLKTEDTTLDQAEAVAAAGELGRTVLKHMPLVISCLKNAGK